MDPRFHEMNGLLDMPGRPPSPYAGGFGIVEPSANHTNADPLF